MVSRQEDGLQEAAWALICLQSRLAAMGYDGGDDGGDD